MQQNPWANLIVRNIYVEVEVELPTIELHTLMTDISNKIKLSYAVLSNEGY